MTSGKYRKTSNTAGSRGQCHSKSSETGNGPMQFHIRWMIRRDMAEVLEIENRSFEHPWEEDDFIRCLRQRNCIGMVAENGERVAGFMIYALHRTSLELLSIAVHPNFRRNGAGRAMIGKLVNKLSQQRRNRITLVVRETNLSGQLFFRDTGFLATQVVKSRWIETDEDGYSMELSIIPPSDTSLCGPLS